jgi:hypothetical protein
MTMSNVLPKDADATGLPNDYATQTRSGRGVYDAGARRVRAANAGVRPHEPTRQVADSGYFPIKGQGRGVAVGQLKSGVTVEFTDAEASWRARSALVWRPVGTIVRYGKRNLIEGEQIRPPDWRSTQYQQAEGGAESSPLQPPKTKGPARADPLLHRLGPPVRRQVQPGAFPCGFPR